MPRNQRRGRKVQSQPRDKEGCGGEGRVSKFLTEMLQGSGCQSVKRTFYKYNPMGVYIEGRRGTGAWEFLAIDTEGPCEDKRPLLAPGQPEGREYRMRFWGKGTPNGG